MTTYTDSFAGSGPLGAVEQGGLTWEVVSGSWERLNGKAYSSTSPSSNPIAVLDPGIAEIDFSLGVHYGGGDALYFRLVDASNWWRLRVQRDSTTTTNYVTEYQWAQSYQYIGGGGMQTLYGWGSFSTPPSFPDDVDGKPKYGSPSKTGTTRQVQSGTSTTYYYYIKLEKCVAGTVTTVQTYNTSSSLARLRVVARGDVITPYTGATQQADVTDAAHETATKHGIGLAGGSEHYSSGLDDFSLFTFQESGGSGGVQTFFPTGTGRLGSIQSWTVPSDGRYKIECWGAEGSAGNGGVGGKGAHRFGEIALSAGDVIKIIVGQAGVRSSSNYEGGGGGGSFVYKETGVELLCAAGGGGGASNSGPGGNAVITEAGGASPNGAAGGTGGNGGTAAHSSGGGGWNTTGGVGTWSSGTYTENRPGSACKPGATYDHPSALGSQASGGNNTGSGAVGGFGGGASAHGNSYTAGGGGGGYSGGGGANQAYGGGGGGSFIHASMTNPGGTAGTRTGAGLVVITALNSPPLAPTDLELTTGMTDVFPLAANWTHVDTEGDPQDRYQARWRKVI